MFEFMVWPTQTTCSRFISFPLTITLNKRTAKKYRKITIRIELNRKKYFFLQRMNRKMCWNLEIKKKFEKNIQNISSREWIIIERKIKIKNPQNDDWNLLFSEKKSGFILQVRVGIVCFSNFYFFSSMRQSWCCEWTACYGSQS